jgi:hypothetical protein
METFDQVTRVDSRTQGDEAQAFDRRGGPPHQQVGLLCNHHVRWRGKCIFPKKVACFLTVNEYKETNSSTLRRHQFLRPRSNFHLINLEDNHTLTKQSVNSKTNLNTMANIPTKQWAQVIEQTGKRMSLFLIFNIPCVNCSIVVKC